MASTTSTEQSGLFQYLLPFFTEQTGIRVRVVAVGSGQALDIGRRGDADVVLVHDRAEEDKFLAEGEAVARFDVMYNDFILVGPKTDPAKIANMPDAASALRRIAQAKSLFISRGDRSGTNAAELLLWRQAGIDLSDRGGGWYREIGQGMGPVLNTAKAMGAYTPTDRGTWLSFKNHGELVILSQGDHRLFNQYGVMLVNPAKHPAVHARDGQTFVDWLLSSEGQMQIGAFTIDGEQLFFPNYNPGKKRPVERNLFRPGWNKINHEVRRQ